MGYYLKTSLMAFQPITELQAFKIYSEEDQKPSGLTEVFPQGQIGLFYVAIAWLIPLLGIAIAYFLWRKKF